MKRKQAISLSGVANPSPKQFTASIGGVTSVLDAATIAERLRAAANSLPPGVTTYFGDEDPPVIVAKEPSTLSQAASENPSAQQEVSETQSEHMLAALLDYKDDSSDSEHGNEEEPKDKGGDSSGIESEKDSETDALDKELANFMDELESSGLLKDVSTEEAMDVQTEQEPDANLAAIQQDAEPGSSDLGTSSVAGDTASSETQQTGSTEQKVLGHLADDPQWAKVLDTGSGKVYFWHISNNAVVWDPPAGTNPDKLAESHAAEQQIETRDAGSAETSTPSETQATTPPAAVHAESAVTIEQHETQEAESATDTVLVSEATSTQATPANTTEVSSTAAQSEMEEGQVSDSDVQLSELATVLLHHVSGDVHDVLVKLRIETRKAAQDALKSLPKLVRLAVELEVRFSDWQAFSGLQQHAVDSGNMCAAMSWRYYERHTLAAMQRIVSMMPGAIESHNKEAAAAAAAAAAAKVIPIHSPHEDDMEVDTSATAHTSAAMPGAAAGWHQPNGFAYPGYGYDPSSMYFGGMFGMVPPMPAPAPPPPHEVPPPPEEPPAPPPPPEEGEILPPLPADDGHATPPPPGLDEAPLGVGDPPLHAPSPPSEPSIAPPLPTEVTLTPAVDSTPEAIPPTSTSSPAFIVNEIDSLSTTALPPAADEQTVSPSELSSNPSATAAPVPPAVNGYTAVNAPSSSSSPPLSSTLPVISAAPVITASASVPVVPTPSTATISSATLVTTSTEVTGSAMADKKRPREKSAGVASSTSGSSTKKLKAKGKVSELISKWSAVRKDLEEEELAKKRAEEEQFDPKALEKKKRHEIQQWKAEQHRSGQAEQNANFQPLPGDWRARLKAKKAGVVDGTMPLAEPHSQ